MPARRGQFETAQRFRSTRLIMEHLADTLRVADLLSRRLAGELPGVAAQLRMSPRPRHGWSPDVYPADCRQAAGLLLVYPLRDRSRIVLTQRADLPDHGGQVSLPGGEMESDETAIEAALREAREEVGIEPQLVKVLGALTPIHIPVSNFVLHPIVGTARERPTMRADDSEVKRILEPEIAELADPARQAVRTGTYSDPPPLIPYFRVQDLEVWGATAMILAEFLAVLDAAPDPWTELRETE